MKIPCEMIKDILPLYYDEVCSDITKKMVDEHLNTCNACKLEFQNMNEDDIFLNTYIDESTPIKKVAKAWQRQKMKAFVKGAIVTGIIGVIAIVFVMTLIIPRPLPTKFYEVSQRSMLEGGRVHYFINVEDGPYIESMKYEIKDGAIYLIPMSPVISRVLNSDNSTWRHAQWEDIVGRTYEEFENGEYIEREIKALYMGTENDRIVIWEDGEELPKASEELEAKYGRNK